MDLQDFFFSSKHAAGTVMPIPLPDGEDSGEWLRVIGPACDDGVNAGRNYSRAYNAILEELSSLDEQCKVKNNWTRYNAEMNWRADELNDVLAAAIVIDWSFDEPFTKERLANLLKEYKGLSTIIAKHFHDSRKSLQEK